MAKGRQKRPPARRPSTFTVVGIGASAGGIEALGEFFGSMPSDSGMAFIVILHLDPSKESHAAQVLGRHTSMPVYEAADKLRVQPNQVYVILPDKTLTIESGVLRMRPPKEPHGLRRPVDDFFASLAEQQQERSVAVLLSGAGTNGTSGAGEIKASGGLVIAQAPETARFPGMPQSAISAGLADFVAAPQQMPERLMAFVRHSYVREGPEAGVEPDDLNEILSLLRARSSHDFRSYKKPTLIRRIRRRMGLAQVQKMSRYAQLLRESPHELKALVQDLLINVTGFFRDPEAWEKLAQVVIEPLLQERPAHSTIRAWVTGCSTGEEAYSLAMLLAEHADRADKSFEIKIFATDTAEHSLMSARQGVYPESAAAMVSPERLRRFFDKLDHHYQVKKSLREMVTFAPQNLLNDPPFSRIDLVTCRNLLIYLEPEVQKRVLSLLHFSLREGGHLFMGNAESLGRTDDLFEPLSRKHKIYRRIGPTRYDRMDFPTFPPLEPREHMAPDMSQPPAAPPREPMPRPRATPAHIAQQFLLDHFAPAAVLIDKQMRVLYFHGPTDLYLTHPRGEPTRDLLALAREGLRIRLRLAINKALESGARVSYSSRVRRGKQNPKVTIEVRPLPGRDEARPMLLVSFSEEAPAQPVPTPEDPPERATERHLEQELRSSREELQSTIEELETANEELKASNEEIISMNEELQSTNEELETSKEELQSLNEELNTVNSQLQAKVQEAEDATNDLRNLLNSTDIATLFLDREMQIKWFTPAVGKLLSVISSDIGRPISNFAQKFAQVNLGDDASDVLERLVPLEKEAVDQEGRWYILRAAPYRTHDDRIDGVVISFIDITERKRAEQEREALLKRLEDEQSALRSAKEDAEAANRAKDDFLSSLSHELRTPLSPVLLAVSALDQRGDLPPEVRDELRMVHRNIELEARLIDDLLDLARINRGRIRLNCEHLDAWNVIEQVREICAHEIDSKKLVVNATGESGRCWVYADPLRLKQVMWNLLRNAIKYTPSGGQIRMRCASEPDRVVLEVADRGSGIEPEKLARVFDAFNRPAGHGDPHAGLGLGLAISRALVEAHGGTITAQSDGIGTGALFRVILPASGDSGRIGRKHRADDAPQAENSASSRILLIEDHRDTANILERLLRRQGHEIRLAHDLSSALQLYHSEAFDVIVSDLNLPDGSGIDLMQRIAPTDPPPAIALTGFGSEHDVSQTRAAGFARHLTKPIDYASLAEAITQVLGKKDSPSRCNPLGSPVHEHLSG